MMNRRILAALLLFIFSYSTSLSSEIQLFCDILYADGLWEKGTILDRAAVFTNKAGAVSSVKINIPKAGRYQLFGYIYHNWRKSVPNFCIEAIDSKGTRHKGYHKIENIWYLNESTTGRWFFVSLSQNPYWELPEGKLKINFRAEAKDSTWGKAIVPMESIVAIGGFFLVPVLNSDKEIFMPWLISHEQGKGGWDSISYHQQYGTDLIQTNKKNALFSYVSHIPIAGYYRLVLSVLSSSDNFLEIAIGDMHNRYNFSAEVKSCKTWRLISTNPVYLNKGKSFIKIRNVNSDQIMVDFLLLQPDLNAIK